MTFKITVHIHADRDTVLCQGNQEHTKFTFGAKGRTKNLALVTIKTMLNALYCRNIGPEDYRDITEELEYTKEGIIEVIETTDLGTGCVTNIPGPGWEIRMENKDE
jgi:hypothetical protein